VSEPRASKTEPAAGKRRLPIVREPELADASDEERPPWHWSAIGAVAVFCAWLPLAALVNALMRRLLEDGGTEAALAASQRYLMIGANALAFLLASFAGGLLVGRFGAKVGRKEATVSGLVAAAIAWALAALQGARSGLLVWLLLLVVVAVLGAAASRLGGVVGLRMRR